MKDLLRAAPEVDRRDMALVVACIPGVAAVHDIQIRRAAGARRGERRGAFLVLRLERGEFRPAAAHDLGTIADLVLVRVAIQPIAVDELAIRIDRGRRGRVADAAIAVDAQIRAVLVAPDGATAPGVERED